MLDDIVRERRKKLEMIRNAGIDPYPARVARTHAIGDALVDFAKLAETGKTVSLAGRLRSMRDQGKIIFADIADESGQIQLVLKEDVLTSTNDLGFWRSVLDLGDFISATGILFETKRGEKSVEVRELQMAAKSCCPCPTSGGGLRTKISACASGIWT